MRENENNDTVLDLESHMQDTSTSSTSQVGIAAKVQNNIQNKAKANVFYSYVSKPHNQITQLNKKPKLFETTNALLIGAQTVTSVSPSPIEPNLPQISSIPKFKENYLDLLINTSNKLLMSGNITMNYLNTPTLNPKQYEVSYSTSEDELLIYSKKCENPICAVVVENYLFQLTKAKFDTGKFKTVLLCEQCYSAWTQDQYCFYCNIIYRDFSFNQQYYDKHKWIQCDYCQKWEHVQCEESKGIYTHIEELNKNKDFKYKCPFCRGKNNKQSNKKSKCNNKTVVKNELLNKKRKKRLNY